MSKSKEGAINPADDRYRAEDFLANVNDFDSHGKDVCVLFADLVGSTEFKRDRPAVEGLAKTVVHNNVVTAQVQGQGGRVVKYIGDGVLAVFEDARAAKKALTAGLEIIAAVEAENKNQRWDYPKSMSTRIGVHQGKAWFFQYAQSNELDPQGETVDLAARLCALAGPQQLVCTEESFQAAGGDDNFPFTDGPRNWFIKGITDPVKIRTVAADKADDEEVEMPPFCAHERPLLARCQATFEAARTALMNKRYGDAIRLYREIRESDPGNFEVNYRLAELLIRVGNGGIQEGQLDEALTLLWSAKQVRPEAARCWLLASWARFKLWEKTGNVDMLTRAMHNAEVALDKANKYLDVDARLQTMILLAACLRQHFGLDPDNNAGDLALAARYCEETRRAFEGTMNRHRSSYLVTHVQVLLDQGSTDFDSMRIMIEEAQAADDNNVQVHEVRAELARREGRSGDPNITPMDPPITPGL